MFLVECVFDVLGGWLVCVVIFGMLIDSELLFDKVEVLLLAVY